MSQPIRDINSVDPFHKTWERYVEKGWVPIALKPGMKNPDSVGTTGRKNPLPKNYDARVEWISRFAALAPDKANIGLRMDETVIGIDIDHYGDKQGYSQYLKMVERFGELPPTVISTARPDGHKSGIRFFRIPNKYVGKLSWSGKASSHIDIIQYVHRFAAVYPSWNPDAKQQYRWYDSDWNELSELPNLADLPDLPEEWVKFLTRGYVSFQSKPMDMDSSLKDVQKWYEDHTAQGDMCKVMKKYLNTAISNLDDAAAHDPLVNGHYSILMAAVDDQGHRGSLKAAKQFEDAWMERVKAEDGKRNSLREAKAEIYRSKAGALRLAKGRIMGDSRDEDTELLDSIDWNASACRCADLSEVIAEQEKELASTIATVPLDSGKGAPTSFVRDPSEYDRSDDGNAEFLYDLTGHDNLKFVIGIERFIMWNGSRWTKDNAHHSGTRRIFQKVRDRQRAYAKTLENAISEAVQGVESARDEAEGGVGDAKAELAAAKGKFREWNSWAQNSGNMPRIRAALQAYQAAAEDSTLELSKLDASRNYLGMANGLLELGKDGYVFRQAEYSDYVTLSTGIDYCPGGMSEIIRKGGDIAEAAVMWERYLNQVMPDLELREFVQRALGAALGGPNRSRLIYFFFGDSTTGKSTLIRFVERALGEYSSPIGLGIFSNSKLNPALGDAMDKRVVVASEVSASTQMDEGIVKMITGNDPLSVEYKNSNDLKTGIFNATVVIATNHAPRLQGADQATYRRLCVMPFNEVISEKDKDDSFGDVFIEKGGLELVFHWMLEGYLAFAKKGLRKSEWPERVKEVTDRFGNDMSDIGEFIEETLVATPYQGADFESRSASALEFKSIYKAYENWCNKQKVQEADRMTVNMFSRRLRSQGFVIANHRMEKGSKPAKVVEGVQFHESYGEIVNFKGTS